MKKRAVLMSRVSSEEQAKGFSLSVQSDALRKYCERNDIEVVYDFTEDHSAKDFNRPAFKKFLEFAKRNRGGIDLILFTSWDRFSRNIMDAYMMIDQLKRYGILPFAIEQPIDLSIPENKVLLAVYLVIPEVDNDRRSIKIRGGMRAALKAGRWCRQAPVGYKNMRDEKNRPIIVPSVHAASMTWAFEQVALAVPQSEILQEFKKRGLNLSRSRLSTALRLPIYIGKIEVPAEGKEPYSVVDGIHDPIVSRELFNRVQAVLNGSSKKRTATKNSRDSKLPLRGILLCSKCGSNMTGSRSRNNFGTRYAYYHCNYCHKERYRSELVNDALSDILNSIQLDNDSELTYCELVKRLLKGDGKEQTQKVQSLETVVNLQSERIMKLQDNLADGVIESADYMEMKTRYLELKRDAELQITELKQDNSGKTELLTKALRAIEKMGEQYTIADSKNKLLLLNSIFPEKIEFDGIKCRTVKINEALALCLSIDAGFSENKNGKLHEKLEVSRLVAPSRIELLSKV